jgi:hypothetical protein
VTIPAGQTSRTFTVPVNGDRLPESNETFAVNLSAATNATIIDGQGVGTIIDNEPRVSISDVSKYEGRKGKSTAFTFTVTLSVAYDQPVTMPRPVGPQRQRAVHQAPQRRHDPERRLICMID